MILTREQIEGWAKRVNHSLNNMTFQEFKALCDLALRALDNAAPHPPCVCARDHRRACTWPDCYFGSVTGHIKITGATLATAASPVPAAPSPTEEVEAKIFEVNDESLIPRRRVKVVNALVALSLAKRLEEAQRYPTVDAYEAVCKARTKWQEHWKKILGTHAAAQQCAEHADEAFDLARQLERELGEALERQDKLGITLEDTHEAAGFASPTSDLEVPQGESRWLVERTYAKGQPAERREFWLGVPADVVQASFNHASNTNVWTTNALEAARFSSRDIAYTLRLRYFHPEADVEACEHLFQCGIGPNATADLEALMADGEVDVTIVPPNPSKNCPHWLVIVYNHYDGRGLEREYLAPTLAEAIAKAREEK